MNDILKLLEEADKSLFSIKVSGDDVFTMAKVRTSLKDIYEKTQNYNFELKSLRDFRNAMSDTEKEDVNAIG